MDIEAGSIRKTEATFYDLLFLKSKNKISFPGVVKTYSCVGTFKSKYIYVFIQDNIYIIYINYKIVMHYFHKIVQIQKVVF